MAGEHVDVVIVGAGLSGVGAAVHVTRGLPGKSVAILEAREAIGGTWDLFRYPGVRSDSDMFTLGYRFRPWTGAKALADGPSILQYVRETAREYGVDRLIRFGHRVVRADWSSDEARWRLTVERGGAGPEELTCSFLYVCSGYYRYDEGYTPELPGVERFRGPVVHPQHWPDDLDFAGRRVVVIGSGATAVTLVPAMARSAAHVTMLQRSPSYILSLPSRDRVADVLRRVLPQRAAYGLVRWKNVLLAALLYRLSRRRPARMRAWLQQLTARQLPEGYDVRTHFTPRYDPWDQRLCLIPDGDLFRAIRHGRASIATDTIATFTETGVDLGSGEHLDADVIVTATGLNLLPIGGIELIVDGEQVILGDQLTYRGMMLSDVPNLALTIGYTNASWTLKADLVAQYVVRLLRHLDERGYASVVPVRPEHAGDDVPLIDLESGYVLRSRDQLPKQGPQAPWRLYQNYPRDVRLLRRGPIEDGTLRFSPAPVGARS